MMSARQEVLYEMIDTICYSPGHVTKTSSHVRDAVDMKRIMTTVWICAFFPMIAGMYFCGLQANIAMETMEVSAVPGWRGDMINFLLSLISNILLLIILVPLLIIISIYYRKVRKKY